jgi:hypothetical protein
MSSLTTPPIRDSKQPAKDVSPPPSSLSATNILGLSSLYAAITIPTMRTHSFSTLPQAAQVALLMIPVPVLVCLLFAFPSIFGIFNPFFRLLGFSSQKRRTNLVFPEKERVLILGATSGIGESIALEYAKRGAYVCVVGRRGDRVKSVMAQCNRVTREGISLREKAIGAQADFTVVEDVVRVREQIEKGS